jgi:hypothetical protein
MKYNHAIDMGFEFITTDEDPITKENLLLLVEAARKRLDSILENEEIGAFGVFDTHEEE